MGYLVNSDVFNALREDKETSLMCYDDQATKNIIRFCYDSIEKELDRLPQYRMDGGRIAFR